MKRKTDSTTTQDRSSPEADLLPARRDSSLSLPLANHPIYEVLSRESVEVLQRNGIIQTTNVYDTFRHLKDSGEPSTQLQSQVGEAVAELFVNIRVHNRRSAALTVLTYFLVGTLLNEMAPKFPRKADYMIWLRNAFGRQHHLEALRQARKIARLGPEILGLSFLGKNRCLEMYYLLKQLPDELSEADRPTCEQIIKDLAERYWKRDLENQSDMESEDAGDIRLTMDSIVTLYRLKVVGIDETICSFEQAKMMAAYRGMAIESSHAKAIQKELDKYATVDEKKHCFDDYVMSRMTLPHESNTRPMSLRQLLASFGLWKSRRGQMRPQDLGAQLLDLKHNPHTQEALKETYNTIKALARLGGFSLQE